MRKSELGWVDVDVGYAWLNSLELPPFEHFIFMDDVVYLAGSLTSG